MWAVSTGFLYRKKRKKKEKMEKGAAYQPWAKPSRPTTSVFMSQNDSGRMWQNYSGISLCSFSPKPIILVRLFKKIRQTAIKSIIWNIKPESSKFINVIKNKVRKTVTTKKTIRRSNNKNIVLLTEILEHIKKNWRKEKTQEIWLTWSILVH